MPPTGPPRALHATLRPYQQRGLAWLAMMSSLGLGGYLADNSDTSSHRTHGPR